MPRLQEWAAVARERKKLTGKAVELERDVFLLLTFSLPACVDSRTFNSLQITKQIISNKFRQVNS